MSSTRCRSLLESLAGVIDDGEPVNELAHALQCAKLALCAGRDAEFVTAALLHDIARSPYVAEPGSPHERVAAQWLRPRFGQRVAWLAGAHVSAKIHLLLEDPSYGDRLSAASRRSALDQLGSLTTELRVHPWWQDALELRRFDDAAKDPCAPFADLDELIDIVCCVSAAYHGIER